MAHASVIAGSAVIRGNVRGDTSLELLGRVEGDVSVTGDLTVGPEAAIVGTVSGARIVIVGSVEGDVTATEAVVIAESGRVIGDLVAPRIGMSEGAEVRGSVRTDANGAAAGSRLTAVRAPAEARNAPAHVAAAAPAPRPVVVAAPTGGAPVAVLSAKPGAIPAPPKKAPPPPVIPAPRPGVRARKKLARR